MEIYILQINNSAENILNERFGKMAWGVGSVYLRFMKFNTPDKKKYTVEE